MITTSWMRGLLIVVRELAQMVERLTFNQLVAGSIPALPIPYENQF